MMIFARAVGVLSLGIIWFDLIRKRHWTESLFTLTLISKLANRFCIQKYIIYIQYLHGKSGSALFIHSINRFEP